MTITYHAGRRIQGLSNDIGNLATLDDNFTTNTGWVMNDATAVTISGGKLNASFSADGTNDSVAYNLGFVTGSKWILDYEFNITSFVRGNNVGSYYIVGLSNLNQTANYTTTLQNAMWAIHGCHPYAPYADDIWLGKSVNQSLDITQDGEIGAGITATGGAFPPWLTGTPYYARFIRLSDTSYSFGLYTNPERTTLVEDTSVFTGSLVANSLTNLQYIVIRNYNADSDGSIDITYDNFKFYNGVSSLTSKPTNVQNGSRFEATDTRKIYFYKDPLTLDYGFPDSTNWNTEGTSGKMTISGGKLSFSSNAQSIDARQWYPLGFSVTGNFIMDFTLTQNTATPVASGQAVTMQIGISSFNTGASGEAPSTSAYTQLVISGYPSGDAYINAHKGDGTWLNDTSVRNWGFVTTNSTPIIRYIRISRVNNALTFKAYSDSTRLTQVGSTLSGLSMSNTFNYLFLKVYTQASSNSWNFDLDDIKFYNGTTSTAIWTEES